MGGALAFIEAALRLAPALIQVGQDIKPFAEAVYKAVKGDRPTDADWAVLKAKEAELRAVLHKPLPPKGGAR